MRWVLVKVGLLLCLMAVVLATAGAAQAATYVPLNISGGFNMNAMIGPVVGSQATLAGSNAVTWLGQESQGFTYVFPGLNQNELVCDSSSNDGLTGTTYKYFCTGLGGFSGTGTLTGSQGLPENGIVNSAVDSRTYLIASVSGNALLPGDWTEPPYLGINPNTYTASNNKFNAIWVGQTGNGYGNAYKPFVTASFQPGYYSDLNLLLAGEYEVTKGCAYTQIWATYADVVNGSNSLKLYDWGSYTDSRNSYPIITQSVAPANFKLAYTVGAAGRNGVGSKSVQVAIAAGQLEYLWEFATPLTIDPARVLVSLTVSSTRNGGNNNNAVIVYGSTAAASATASNTLTVQQTTGGNVTTSQSGITTILAGYPYGAQITLTASATSGYNFSSWNVVPAANGSIAGSGSQVVLTIYGSCTVSANFSLPFVTLTTAVNPAGVGSVTPSGGQYSPSSTLSVTANANTGYQFTSWTVNGGATLSNSTANPATLTFGTVSCTLTANFTAIIYTLTGVANPSAGGTVNPTSTTGTMGQVISISETPNANYTFNNWTVTGGATITNSTAASTTLTLGANNCTVTANFNSNLLTGGETVTSLGGLGGGVSVSNSGPYTMNQQFTATETPSAGWVFAGWSITGPSTLSSSTATTPTITVLGNFTLTAFFQLQSVPLDLSSGFNMTDWVGPLMFDYCVAQNQRVNALYSEGPGGLADYLGLMLPGDDPSPLPSYYGTSYTGTTCTPSNGAIVGADRTYYIASVGGNSLLPGDWTETSTSGLRLNTIVIGQYLGWVIPAVTTSTTPGHYSNVNFVLAAGSAQNCPYGANNIKIIANYNDSTSGVVYDFGTYTGTNKYVGPNQSNSIVVPGFRNVYKTADNFNELTGTTGAVRVGSLYLWEFSSPLTLDSTRILVSLTFSNYSPVPANWSGLAIYGATATAAPAAGGLTLTTAVSPGGVGTVTPASETVPGNFTFPVTATPTNSTAYVFDHWTMSDPNAVVAGPCNLGNPSVTNTLTPGATNNLTVNSGNCTLTAYFRSTTGYTDTKADIGGSITLNPNSPYTYGQNVSITASAYWGWYFINWTATNAAVWNAKSASTSMTVYDSFDLTANFGEVPYSVTVSAAPDIAGAIDFDPWEPVYITDSVVAIQAVPEPGWTFVGWTVTGANLTGGNVATSTISVMNNVFLTASFSQNQYTVTVQQPSGGTISLAPSQSKYVYSNTMTITATATGANTFANWVLTGPGQIASYTSSQTTLTVNGNVTLTALLGTTCTLTVSPQNGLGYTVSPAGPYNFGQVVTVTATSLNAGYVLQNWAITGGTGFFMSSSGALSTQLVMDGNCTLSGVYASGSYVNNLSPTASDSNVGSLTAPFMTISKAITKLRSGQAQSIVIQQGTYRETVNTNVSGAAGNYITVRANPGDRVVITGAAVIPQAPNTWTLCTSTTASGNANYAHIYYTDVNWAGANTVTPGPCRLSEDEVPLQMAQTPSNGPPAFWAITGASAGTLTDSVNLTQTDSSYWLGSNLCYYAGLSWFGENTTGNEVAITAYNPATSTLTFSGLGTGLLPGTGVYFLYGSPKLLSGPGQWAVEALSATQSFRVWVWPTGNGRPDGHVYQATYRGSNQTYGLLNLSSGGLAAAYYILDGLEVCYSAATGICAQGTAVGGNHIVRNCVTHDNDWCGICGRGNYYGQYIHNLTTQNGLWYGHQNGGEGGCGFQTQGAALCDIFQENDTGWNQCDGMYMCSDSTTYLGNYIHNNGQCGHCDGIQLCVDGSTIYGNSVTIVNNLFNANGDMIQDNYSNSVTIVNNVVLNTLGWGFQSGCNGCTWDHNTFVGVGGLQEHQEDPLVITNNLVDAGMVMSYWYPLSLPYFSDYNLIYVAPNLSMSNCSSVNYFGKQTSWNSYLASSSMDAHTITGSLPLLNAAPAFVLGGPSPNLGPNQPGYSASTLWIPYISSYAPAWELQNTFAGDNIEIESDGVLRQVQTVDMTNSIITFTPSCAARLWYVYPIKIFNWKTQTCTTKTMDVGLQPGSPAIGAAMDGSDIGAQNFKVADYMAGKLNGQTKRVIPVWPPAPVTLAASGWKYKNGGTAYALTEGNTYTNPNMTGFQLTFGGAPLYAPSCTTSVAVTVVDNTGTTYPINAATLDSTGTILTITLTNGALPRTASWIQVNVGPALMGANGTDPTVGTNGGPVTGVKSIRFTIN